METETKFTNKQYEYMTLWNTIKDTLIDKSHEKGQTKRNFKHLIDLSKEVVSEEILWFESSCRAKETVNYYTQRDILSSQLNVMYNTELIRGCIRAIVLNHMQINLKIRFESESIERTKESFIRYTQKYLKLIRYVTKLNSTQDTKNFMFRSNEKYQIVGIQQYLESDEN